MDITSQAYPGLDARAPLGSLIYSGGLSGLINFAGDTDAYTLNLDAGQTITVSVTPDASLAPTIELRDPSYTVIASATGTEGLAALLQTAPVTAAGIYTITFGAANGTSGAFTATTTLNAAVEAESYGGSDNGTTAGAQDINGSFLDLIEGATRGAVVGRSGDTDVYSFHLDAGQAVSANLGFHDNTPPSIFGARSDYFAYTPWSVAVGDINNDGNLDVVNSSYYGVNLTARLGNGDGTLGSPSDFGYESASQAIALADVDADGNLDAISANSGYNAIGTITIMFGNGDGTFDAAVGYNAGNVGTGLAVGDLNGDTFPDIVTTNYYEGTVTVLMNDGHGAFTSTATYAAGYDPRTVALGDFNNDGALDIVIANTTYGSSSATSTVLLNQGDGLFNLGISYFAGYSPLVVAVGDINGDGNLDFVTSDYSGSTVSVVLGDGLGNFGTPATYYVPGAYEGYAIAVGDVNGDGSLDVVVGSYYNYIMGTGSISTFLNTGDGTLDPALSVPVGYGVTSLALGDLNNDNLPDVVTANFYNYSLSVHMNITRPTTLELIAPDGVTVLATASASNGFQAAFSNFIADDVGTYYLRVSGSPSVRDYSLVVTRDSIFDLGDNDTIETAQPFGPVHVALGHVGSPDDAADVYSFTAIAGQTVHFYTTTPGDGPGEFANSLNPRMRIYNALGVLLAEGLVKADGRNEEFDFFAEEAGTYYVEITAEDGTSGEYLLDPIAVTVASASSEVAALAETTVVTGERESLSASLASVTSLRSEATSSSVPVPVPSSSATSVVTLGSSSLAQREDRDGRRAALVARVAASAGFLTVPSTTRLLRTAKPTELLDEVPAAALSSSAWNTAFGESFDVAVITGFEPEFPSDAVTLALPADEAALASVWDDALAGEVWAESPGEPALMGLAAGSATLLAAVGIASRRAWANQAESRGSERKRQLAVRPHGM